MALLHEVGHDHGLPVRARARRPQGARREQTTAADGPPHRVLQPHRELVLDPFAGVGGTLLGAAIARGPRRALGIELDPRWADVYASVVADLSAEREGRGPLIADLGTADPGGFRTLSPGGLELRVGDALAVLPELEDASIDLVATDPPYNIQLPLTMAGGALAEMHANRRTDYAMISDAPADLANAPDYEATWTGWRPCSSNWPGCSDPAGTRS